MRRDSKVPTNLGNVRRNAKHAGSKHGVCPSEILESKDVIPPVREKGRLDLRVTEVGREALELPLESLPLRLHGGKQRGGRHPSQFRLRIKEQRGSGPLGIDSEVGFPPGALGHDELLVQEKQNENQPVIQKIRQGVNHGTQ